MSDASKSRGAVSTTGHQDSRSSSDASDPGGTLVDRSRRMAKRDISAIASNPGQGVAEPSLSAGRPTNMDHISSSLKQAYDSTLNEAIPDSIIDLLRQLD